MPALRTARVCNNIYMQVKANAKQRALFVGVLRDVLTEARTKRLMPVYIFLRPRVRYCKYLAYGRSPGCGDYIAACLEASASGIVYGTVDWEAFGCKAIMGQILHDAGADINDQIG